MANALLEKLQKIFALFGLPTMNVADNGPPFNSAVVRRYCEWNGIVLRNSPPYHAQSNGLAERGVQTAKKTLIRFCLGRETDLSIQEKIDKYLLHSRNSPTIDSQRSPAEIIFSYKPKIKLDLINDFTLNKNIEKFKANKNYESSKNTKQIEAGNGLQKKTKFAVGESVFYRCHFKNWVEWIPATVKQKVSPVTYLIEVNGTIRFVQENKIRSPSERDKHSKVPRPCVNSEETHAHTDVFNESITEENAEVIVISSDATSPSSNESASDTPIVPGTKRRSCRTAESLRRSKRRNKKVKRFGNNIYDRN